MATQGEFVVDFPTLWVAADWIPQHCIVSDGFHKGSPFELVDWQLWFVVNHYRVEPEARAGQLAPAFFYRRSQIVMPQKAGKAPLTAAQVCLEGVGPALFAGWAAGGEAWDCRDHGCGCGWLYEYSPGEPMGMAWPTPLIQITAFSEEQTDNIYDALRPMIDDGPLHELIPKTGEEFIRLPGGGRIDVVTSSALSRLGQRVTFVPQDETGIWTAANKMLKVADTQRRGLAGMGGRAVETTNAWDPTEDSVAQLTAEAAVRTGDIFRLHPLPPAGLSYRDRRERRRIHRAVYHGSWWVDLDAIEAEAVELLGRDPAQAERFFGNRTVPGEGAAFDLERWSALADPTYTPQPGALVTVGVKGARFDDAVAIIVTEVASGFQWSAGIWETPPTPPHDFEHPAIEIDGAMVELFERFEVWRVYVDPLGMDHLFSPWQGRWGERRVLPWQVNRPRAMAYAVRSWAEAQEGGDVSHDGDEAFARHVGNARRRTVNVLDEKRRPMWTIDKPTEHSPLLVTAARAGCLSWEARSDAIASGVLDRPTKKRARARSF